MYNVLVVGFVLLIILIQVIKVVGGLGLQTAHKYSTDTARIRNIYETALCTLEYPVIFTYILQ